MKVESEKLESGELVIKLTFSSCDQICLENDLLDIVDWYALGPSQQKIASCKKRMLQENNGKIMQSKELLDMPLSEVNKILADDEICVNLIRKHPDYKNRIEREVKL